MPDPDKSSCASRNTPAMVDSSLYAGKHTETLAELMPSSSSVPAVGCGTADAGASSGLRIDRPLLELFDGSGDRLYLLGRQLGEHRQGERFVRRALGYRKSAGPVPQVFVRRLQMGGDRIVDISLNAVRLQVLLQLFARGREDRENMIDGAAILHLFGKAHPGTREEPPVRRGVFPSRRVPVVQVAKLDSQYRALDAFEPVIVADDLVMIFAARSVVAQQPRELVEVGVASHYRAALSVGPEVLAGIKAEARNIAHAARTP